MSAPTLVTSCPSLPPERAQARVWRLGADVDTDVLAPGHAMKHGIEVIARHCLESVRPEFAASVQPGDVIVAGPNFGIGSSREQAARATNNSLSPKAKAMFCLMMRSVRRAGWQAETRRARRGGPVEGNDRARAGAWL